MNRSRRGVRPISTRNRTDLEPEADRSRRGVRPISAISQSSHHLRPLPPLLPSRPPLAWSFRSSSLPRWASLGDGEGEGVLLLLSPTKDFTDVNVQEVFSDGRERSNRYTYFTWPLGLAAAVLLIWELAALVRADRAAAHVTRPAADTGPSGDAAGASGGSARGAAGAAGAAGAVGAPGGGGSMPIPVAAVPGGAVPGAVPGGAVPGAVVPGGIVPGGAVPGATAPGGAVPGGAVPGSAVPGYGGSRGVPGSGAPMGGMR